MHVLSLSEDFCTVCIASNCIAGVCKADNTWWLSIIQAREREFGEIAALCLLFKGTLFLYHCVENHKSSL